MSVVAKLQEGICLWWQNYRRGHVRGGKTTGGDMSVVAKLQEGICPWWQNYGKGYVKNDTREFV